MNNSNREKEKLVQIDHNAIAVVYIIDMLLSLVCGSMQREKKQMRRFIKTQEQINKADLSCKVLPWLFTVGKCNLV